MELNSQRLEYRRLGDGDEQVFHSLVVDPHIKAYLFDGETMTFEWSCQAIKDSQELFKKRNVGIWLMSETGRGEKIGFCGFRHFPRYGEEPELLYAFKNDYTRKGYASECAFAMVSFARDAAKMTRIESAVDSPNIGSKKVLEKVGFQRVGTMSGVFGDIFTYEMVL